MNGRMKTLGQRENQCISVALRQSLAENAAIPPLPYRCAQGRSSRSPRCRRAAALALPGCVGFANRLLCLPARASLPSPWLAHIMRSPTASTPSAGCCDTPSATTSSMPAPSGSASSPSRPLPSGSSPWSACPLDRLPVPSPRQSLRSPDPLHAPPCAPGASARPSFIRASASCGCFQTRFDPLPVRLRSSLADLPAAASQCRSFRQLHQKLFIPLLAVPAHDAAQRRIRFQVASMPIVLPRSRPLAPIRFRPVKDCFVGSHIDQSSGSGDRGTDGDSLSFNPRNSRSAISCSPGDSSFRSNPFEIPHQQAESTLPEPGSVDLVCIELPPVLPRSRQSRRRKGDSVFRRRDGRRCGAARWWRPTGLAVVVSFSPLPWGQSSVAM